MIERVLIKYGFWTAKNNGKTYYINHTTTYGGIYVLIDRDKNERWKKIAIVKIPEVNKVYIFNSAKKLSNFLKRLERNVLIYGFRVIDRNYIRAELDEAYNQS